MLKSWDSRRDYIILESEEKAVEFAFEHWLHLAKRSIQQRGRFAVALSGGSTPKAIYRKLLSAKEKIDWTRVWLFWSDERAVPPDHPDSNYRMAMENGFDKLPIPPSQIFRMIAEKDIEKNALDYEEKIQQILGRNLFDLVMLGIGPDGHSASLFPDTKALEADEKRLVVSNYVPQKKCWRMTFTFPCINQSFHSTFYALGKEKKEIVKKVFSAPILSPFPASKVGTEEHKALWVLDSEAAYLVKK